MAWKAAEQAPKQGWQLTFHLHIGKQECKCGESINSQPTPPSDILPPGTMGMCDLSFYREEIKSESF